MSPTHFYFNCAAPRSVMNQNCNLISQMQSDYPPYPKEVGIYSQQQRPVLLEIPTPNETILVSPERLRKHPSILKHYKSCPVSPVHEETEVSDPSNPDNCSIITETSRFSMNFEFDSTSFNKVHKDTEKLIEEITKKYGDLEEGEKVDESLKVKANKDKNEHGFLSDEDGNFSSDSLEDCSLDLNPRFKRKTCKKHTKTSKNNTLPKRSVSDYFIYDNPEPPVYRNVSLSDILDEDSNNRFLETQRHSSASFFLGQQYPYRKSQESILSDDYSGEGASFCNSMESILSDESDCKSAPLEVLFEKVKKERLNNFDIKLDTGNNSKSYGSSPNGSSFDYFMQRDYFNRDKYDISGYGFDKICENSVPVAQSRPIGGYFLGGNDYCRERKYVVGKEILGWKSRQKISRFFI